MIASELERAGIATAQISTMTPVAEMVGSHRIVLGNGIVHPVGSADASPDEERRIRRKIVERALDALGTEVDQPTVFS
ncbi:MAG: glycine/betaine/sarcosine/D-proline family reductase selenoprotein B [Chloroflexota bacterium]|nr:glycine/betaine/sarcosine/D-proline family reductase selenoprotein B [Chloroflexota bacterium]